MGGTTTRRAEAAAAILTLLALAILALSGCSSGSSRGTPGTLSNGDAGLTGDAGDTPASADGLGVLPVFGSRLIQGVINPAFDQDWYLLEVDVAASETLGILLNPPDNRDYDLQILDANFNLLGGSNNGGDANDTVAISGYTGLIRIGIAPDSGSDFGPAAYAVTFTHTP